MKRFLLLLCALLSLAPARSRITDVGEWPNENVIELGTYNDCKLYALTDKGTSFVSWSSTLYRTVYVNNNYCGFYTHGSTATGPAGWGVVVDAAENLVDGVNLVEDRSQHGDQVYTTDYLLWKILILATIACLHVKNWNF